MDGGGREARAPTSVMKIVASLGPPVFLFVFLATLSVAVFLRFSQHPSFGLVQESSGVQIQDFSSNCHFVKSWWADGAVRHAGTSPYTVDAHLAMMREWAGAPMSVALPSGVYPPTLFVVLGPICALPVRWAFLVWAFAGSLGATWIATSVHRSRIFACLAFASPVAFATLILGQTALLTTTALFALMRVGSDVAGALILAALTIKPPLALTAIAALLACGRWRCVVAGLGVAGLVALALTPWLGPHWLGDYLALMATHDLDRTSPAFAFGLHPETMSNLRAVLHVDLGVADARASLVSNAIWVGAVTAVVALGWWRSLRAPIVWAALVLAYLLFCSHVSSSEDIALVLLIAAFPLRDHEAGGARWLLSLAVVAAMFLSLGIGPLAGTRVPALLAMKAVLGALVVAAARTPVAA
jgi:glycosyl transferase family 87